MDTILYTRVSTEDQEREGTSLDSQLSACREYAQKKGYRIVGEFSDTISGTAESRAGLDDVREAIRSGQAQAVIAYDLDRLARDTGLFLSFEKLCQRYKVSMEFVRGGVSEGPQGSLLNTIRSAVASYERQQIRERTTRGRRESFKRGRAVASETPYGYTKDKDKHLIPDPVEAPIIKQIFKLYLTGISYTKICAILDGQGTSPRNGGRWNTTSIGAILRHPVYRGVLTFEGLEQSVPPLVSEKDWFAVEAKRKHNRSRLKAPRSTERWFPFSGFMKCKCGRAAVGSATPHGKKWYRYLRCSSLTNRAKCDYIANYSAIKIERAAICALLNTLGNPDELKRVAQQTLKEWRDQHEGSASRRTQIDTALRSEESKLKRLAMVFADGSLNEREYKEAKGNSESRIHNLKAEREGLGSAEPPFTMSQLEDSRANMLGILEALFVGDDYEAQRVAIEAYGPPTAEDEEGNELRYETPKERLRRLFTEYNVVLTLEGKPDKGATLSLTLAGQQLVLVLDLSAWYVRYDEVRILAAWITEPVQMVPLQQHQYEPSLPQARQEYGNSLALLYGRP